MIVVVDYKIFLFSPFPITTVNLVQSRFMAADISTMKNTRTKVVDGVLVVTLDSHGSKVNSLGVEITNEFEQIIKEIETNPAINSAVLISAKPGCFVAGADIGMLEACKTAEEASKISREAQAMFKRMENSRKPIVAAINGVCLGGGFELALGCHYRIATKDKRTSFALPEVMLGLLPGGGGTVRMPKLTSIPTALDMALTGKSVKADKAKKLGIVDMLVAPLGPGLTTAEESTMAYLEKVAIATAKDLSTGKLKINREKKGIVNKVMAYAFENNWVKDKVFGKAREQVMKMSGGLYPAPLRVSRNKISKTRLDRRDKFICLADKLAIKCAF